jgi:hypothetical protein
MFYPETELWPEKLQWSLQGTYIFRLTDHQAKPVRLIRY